MSLIAQALTKNHILLDLEVSSKKRLFESVALLIESVNFIPHNEVFDKLLEREKIGSTGLGQGTAIPHGRIEGIQEVTGVFVRLKTPIPFDAPDDLPVQLLFVLLAPEQATDLHLQLLSELAQLFSSRQLREALLKSPDVSTTLSLLQHWDHHA
ncbi:MAG: PTS sugar transporter subunit IIA [Neisseriaceae bacterium]|nr:PTS sugar transporter subunit IIA [Neisseriaceae bacterium]